MRGGALSFEFAHARKEHEDKNGQPNQVKQTEQRQQDEKAFVKHVAQSCRKAAVRERPEYLTFCGRWSGFSAHEPAESGIDDRPYRWAFFAYKRQRATDLHGGDANAGRECAVDQAFAKPS